MSTSTSPPVMHHLATSRPSVLDTLYTDKLTRRPVYATLTHNSLTTLYKIDDSKNVAEVAQIQWDTGGRHIVCVQGLQTPYDEFLVRAKGFFAGHGTRTFLTGGVSCKWRQTENQDWVRRFPGAAPQFWSCYVSSSSTTTNTVSSTSGLLAVFTPPRPHRRQTELIVYERGREHVDMIVFTGILIVVNNGEWRSLRSPHTRVTLEHHLKTGGGGSLPPYTRAPLHLPTDRRPHTANASSADHSTTLGDESDPPPYTSRVDISSPFRF
ncbi:hypothetical protein BD410DRAFT_65423 [Rickenella mellea]|uniref:DUF6593 domain-containing protein n=1 Tax=Rickenella mellea TaxID=50990 RepID=A0A4Y7QBQ7_9AGAM|nr:hypothetical protein BD410DRAFT_65423 [Rickenella mellea]